MQREPSNDPHRLSKSVSYISFNTEVGRNSKFLRLNAEQQEELGGVEYRVRNSSSINEIACS